MSDLPTASYPPLGTPVRRPRLLIVDDDPVNLAVVGSFFEEDHDVTLLDSAVQALEYCAQELPDLILLDIVMPEIDGIDLCKRLKAESLTRDIPIIFITAQGTPREETTALNAGAVDFITKPVNPAVVRARVRTHLTLKAQSDFLRSLAFLDGLSGVANRRRFEEALDTEWRRRRRSGASLCLIMIDIDHFKRYNDRYGHPAGDVCLQTVARTFEATLRRAQDLAARYGGEAFACILPETDLDVGMNDYLSKPLNPRLLMAVLNRFLGASSAPTTPMSEVPPLDLAVPVFDEAGFLDRLLGNRKAAHRAILAFLADAPVCLERLHTALAGGDATALKRELHTLKGASATLGGAALQAKAAELEARAASVQLEDLLRLQQTYEQLKARREAFSPA